MNDEQSIFNEALAQPAEARAMFMDQACSGNADLRRRVEVLLAAHERVGSFLDVPPHGVAVGPGNALLESTGATIGPYKLLEQIGEGGMGVVFMAEQLHPVRRKVALKIIKPGTDTKQVIARFEAERQALAMMDHPNIAKVLEAGATDAGHPYFVMELVKGIPITEYCDQNQLSPRQRLELFIQVCHAVQHAHQKGIIHRDLKPTNVLVTLQDSDKPTPKVIDFGIAKATAGERLTDRTLFTEFHQLVGTPLYMSPEQAEMSALLDVDTRSDVYSLGVLLYELLTGTTPFDKHRLAKAAHDEVRRIIREEEPPRPSTRISTLGQTLTTVSAQRRTDPKKLGSVVRGELDWIVMRALEKDRRRRYDTASSLAQDVERYLSDQPVEACSPSRIYRLRKFTRRNKATITVAALMIGVLMLATIVSTWQGIRAKRAERQTARERDQVTAEKRRADDQAAIAKAVNEFFNKDVLGQASAENQASATVKPDRDLTVREALDRAAESVARRFREQPSVQAAIHRTIGNAYADLGERDKAEGHLTAALRLCREHAGAESPDALSAEEELGCLYQDMGRFAEAEALYKHALEGQRKTLGSDDGRTKATVSQLASLYSAQDRYAEAEPLALEAYEVARRVFGERHPSTLLALNELAVLYFQQGQYAKAEPLYLEALRGEREVLGNEHPSTMIMICNVGIFYAQIGDYAKAERYLSEAAELSRQVNGDEHPGTLNRLEALGSCYLQQRQFTKAQEILEPTLQKMRKALRGDDPKLLLTMQRLAIAYLRLDQPAKAKPLLLEALEGQRRVLGEQHQSTLNTMNDLAGVYEKEGQSDQAEALYLKAWQGKRIARGERHRSTLITLGNLCQMYVDLHSYEKAEPLLLNGLQDARLGLDENDAVTSMFRYSLAQVYHRQGQYEKAEPLYLEALATRRNALGEQHSDTRKALNQLLALYEGWGKPEQAAAWRAKMPATAPTTNPSAAATTTVPAPSSRPR